MNKAILYAFIICSILSSSCTNSTITSNRKLQLAIKYSGENAPELLKVIKHYSEKDKDSLKLKAACFLIQNMIGKGSIRLTKTTEKGGNVKFDVFNSKFKNGIDSINKLKKKFEDSAKCGLIYYTSPRFVEDIKVIKANYLIENIDYAFKAWKMPWAKNLSFDQFKEYILPYRFGNEPLQKWRKRFFNQGKWIYKNKKIIDRVKLASIVNDSLVKIFKWYANEKLTYYPAPLSIAQLKITKGGNCDDLNMLVADWLRAIGVPVSSEFTTYWGNSNYGGHSWLGILDTTGKFVPMNAMYDDPVRDSLPFGDAQLAKAYRIKFQINPLYYEKESDISYLIDITKEYLPVINYTMKIDTTKYKNAYIGVLNGLYWKPLETKTAYNRGYVTFYNIARNVLYAPLTITNDTIKTIGKPFFVSKNGTLQYYSADTNQLSDIRLDIHEFISQLYNKECEIIYWNNNIHKWERTGSTRTLTIDPQKLREEKRRLYLKFDSVPSNAIYRIVDANKKLDDKLCGRPFFYNKDLQTIADY